MSIWFLLAQPFAQHALIAAALVAVACGLIAPSSSSGACPSPGTASPNWPSPAPPPACSSTTTPVAGALVGSLVVAALIATLGASPRERDSAIGAILAFGMGIGILLLGFYQGFATAATNILVVINLLVVAVMATWNRPLLFASIDPEVAEARGVPVGRLGLLFLLVLSLAVTPAAAAQRLSASPLVVLALSVVFAVVAADGGLLASFGAVNIKASVFITSISFAIYLAGRLASPCSGTAASDTVKPARASLPRGHTRATYPVRRTPAPDGGAPEDPATQSPRARLGAAASDPGQARAVPDLAVRPRAAQLTVGVLQSGIPRAAELVQNL